MTPGTVSALSLAHWLATLAPCTLPFHLSALAHIVTEPPSIWLGRAFTAGVSITAAASMRGVTCTVCELLHDDKPADASRRKATVGVAQHHGVPAQEPALHVLSLREHFRCRVQDRLQVMCMFCNTALSRSFCHMSSHMLWWVSGIAMALCARTYDQASSIKRRIATHLAAFDARRHAGRLDGEPQDREPGVCQGVGVQRQPPGVHAP